MLGAAADALDADWVVAGVRDFASTVGSIVPAGFDAYARVFHPALRGSGDDEIEVRWAEVAAAQGRSMHPAAEWGSLVGSWQDRPEAGLWDQQPLIGKLPEVPAKRLATVLKGHTRQPERCCFALWDGHETGALQLFFSRETSDTVRRRAQESAEAERTAWRDLVKSGALFTLPSRDMRLLHGPLAAIEEFYEFHHYAPNLWWPQDRAWCVGTDIDLMSTYLGGSSACIEAVLGDDQLEALPASVDQSVTWDGDVINPIPTPPWASG